MDNENSEVTPDSHTISPSPLPRGESQWILNALNDMRDRLDERYDRLDERLRKIENTLSTYKGYLIAGFAVLTVLSVVLRFVNLDASLR